MYVKNCKTCFKEVQCWIGNEPKKCECGGKLVENIVATEIAWAEQKAQVPQGLKDSFVKKVKTLGQLAEQNAKRLGRYGLEAKLEENKTKKAPAGDGIAKREMELPEGSSRRQMTPTKMDRDLLEATPQEIKKYIETGQRPIPKARPTVADLKKEKKEKVKEKSGKRTRIIST